VKPKTPVFRLARGAKLASALAVLLAAGVVAATATTSTAAPLDCGLPVCPTVSLPTLPTVSAPLPVTLPTTSTASPPPAGGTPGPATTTTDTAAASAQAFGFTVVRASLRRSRHMRWLELQVSLSHPALVVAILHRAGIPALVQLSDGHAGATTIAVPIPARVHAGRYVLRVVGATGTARTTYTRMISVPR
jgi:hypothetical protein